MFLLYQHNVPTIPAYCSYYTSILFLPHLASEGVNGRFTLMEELQEPLVDCQEMVCVCVCVCVCLCVFVGCCLATKSGVEVIMGVAVGC